MGNIGTKFWERILGEKRTITVITNNNNYNNNNWFCCIDLDFYEHFVRVLEYSLKGEEYTCMCNCGTYPCRCEPDCMPGLWLLAPGSLVLW